MIRNVLSLALLVCWSSLCVAEGEDKLKGKYVGKSPDGKEFSLTFDGKKSMTLRLGKEKYWSGTYKVKLQDEPPHHINFEWKKGTIKMTKGKFQGIFKIEETGEVRMAIGLAGAARPMSFGKKTFLMKRETE